MGDSNKHNNDSLKDTRWAGVIQEILEWPSGASEWESDQVGKFAEQVRLVAEQKYDERKEAGRLRLQQALHKLRGDYESDLAFFEFEGIDIAHWQTTHCSNDLVLKRTKMVDDFLKQLDRHHTLNQQSPRNIQEARKQRTDLQAVEDRINSLAKQLDQEFSMTDPEPQQTLDEDIEDDDEPVTEPPKPGKGPSGDHPDSDEEQQAEKDARPSENDSKGETSSAEQEAKAELSDKPEESEPKHSQPPDEKPATLRSVQEVAVLLEEDDSDENWESLGWSLLASGDWAGAYWLARSLEAKGRDVPVAPELLAVLQGSRWLEDDADVLVHAIKDIATDWTPRNNAERLLGLAAAVRPALIAPYTGLTSWLPQRDEVVFPLGTLADVIRTFARAGYPLRSNDLLGVENQVDLTENIRETATKARRLLEYNKVRRLKMVRATNVLRRLVDRDGDLALLLDPVSNNRTDELERVQQQAKDLKGRKIEDRVHQIDRELTPARPSRPITGVPRDQLVRSIEEAVTLADHWCSLIKKGEVISTKGDWWTDLVKELRDQIQAVLPDVTSELDRMQHQENTQQEAACARVLLRATDQVTCMLGLDERPDSEDPDAWMRRESGSLKQALARRLLWLPDVSLDGDGYPKKDQVTGIAKHLRQSLTESRTLSAVCAMRIEMEDFRFTDVLRTALADDKNCQLLEDRIDDTLKGARSALDEKVAKVQSAIEQQLVDGLLVEEERAALSNELEMTTIKDPLYFRPLFNRLGEIDQQLNQNSIDRLQELEDQWTQMRQGLEQEIQGDQLEAVEQFIQKAFQQRDTRVVEEGLARLREVCEGASEWQREWFEPHDERDVFKEFQKACHGIETELSESGNVNQLAGMIEQGQTWGNVQFGKLPKTRRNEAAKALKSWHQLKRQHGQPTVAHLHVPVLLAYLGFHLPEKESALRVKSRNRDWLHCEVDASASDLVRPIPQLGSQARGCYNVVCLWERPGAASIGAFLRDLGLDTKTVIVFFLGRLTERRRRDIAARTGERELALVVLDEILLVFLARFDDTRLPPFLRCSLPYAALNPYTPFQAGNVPPEMYYGRDKMVGQLQNEGSCIVFGGRQLGKSALLRQVEREFHRPDREQFAWVEDIKLVGDPISGERPAQLWLMLRDGFKKLSLIKNSVTAIKPDNIIKHIQNAMDESTRRRVLVLFDEADHFLDADARSNFQVVEGLRALMQNTQSRFKVVFTGLHDVQRFNNIANQPLAHFGQNLLVGPLEAGPARQLVREPLETLGYRFDDDTTVLKVLSYTNYHPGLIQYFCYELLRRLQTKRHSSGPPYKVSSEDVEAVYRSDQARQVIRERLDWTLALDPRYQCIAWAMIYEQRETRDSYLRSFGVKDLLELARYWWSQGFGEVDTETLRGLLGEMAGLGILVRNLENRYLLRSPNLVRLMGTEEDIENRLLELSEKSQPAQSQPESQHELLDNTKRLYSPLTLVQEGRLQQTRTSGMSLVFGSQALGMDVLDQALKHLGGSEPIPLQVHADQTAVWLDSYARKQRGRERILTYGRLRGTGGEMAQCVWNVLKMCRNFNQRRRRPLQIVFILKPEAAWTWLKLPTDQRTGFEDQADPVYLRRWDEVGIRQRLSQAGKLDSPEVCEKVCQVTGGWPYLLNYLLRRCSDNDDPRSYAEALGKEIACPRSKLGEELLQQTGLALQAESLRVLQTIVNCGKFSDEDIETLGNLVVGTPTLTIEDCASAVEFLSRLGCLEKANGEYRVEPVLGRIVGHL